MPPEKEIRLMKRSHRSGSDRACRGQAHNRYHQKNTMLVRLATWGWFSVRPLGVPRWIGLALLLAGSLGIGTSAAFAADNIEKPAPARQPATYSTFRVRPQDEVWLVSTRHLGCPLPGKQAVGVKCWRYAQTVWQPASEAEFFASDSPDVVTAVYVHGNQIDYCLAANYGLAFYFELVGKLDAESPVRFVIWSWPSDQFRGPLRDVRTKASRSDVDAYYLGDFLSRMRPDVRVGLLGYSFGARIVSGAMELLGGGSLCRWPLPPGPRPSVHVAMWAAAEHNHWYLPGEFHGRALAAGAAWFNTVNPCDPVLMRYRWIDKGHDAVAVGYAGIYGRNLLPPEVNARIEEVNVAGIINGQHDWRAYLYSGYIQERTRQHMLWLEPGLGAPREPAAQNGRRMSLDAPLAFAGARADRLS
jgi:hypothetical protein